jgi:adhesin/invasin
LHLAQFSPAFFEYPLGSGIPAALDEGNNVITEQNPAPRDKVVQLFINGLGGVDHQQVSGEPTPGPPPLVRTTTTPIVRIGGQQATVDFSGLAPFLVGLYQVNVRVPAGLAPGNHPLLLTIGGVPAKTLTLPVK